MAIEVTESTGDPAELAALAAAATRLLASATKASAGFGYLATDVAGPLLEYFEAVRLAVAGGEDLAIERGLRARIERLAAMVEEVGDIVVDLASAGKKLRTVVPASGQAITG